MKKITKYVTSDGKEFESKGDAGAYQTKLDNSEKMYKLTDDLIMKDIYNDDNLSAFLSHGGLYFDIQEVLTLNLIKNKDVVIKILGGLK